MQNSRITLLMVLATIALIVGVALAGSVTNNYAESVTFGSMKRSVWDWSISAGTGVEGTIGAVNGEIYRVVVPGQVATNLYDIYLYDNNDVDLLLGNGLQRSTTTLHLWGNTNELPIASAGDMRLVVTNHGPAAVTSGVIVLYYR